MGHFKARFSSAARLTEFTSPRKAQNAKIWKFCIFAHSRFYFGAFRALVVGLLKTPKLKNENGNSAASMTTTSHHIPRHGGQKEYATAEQNATGDTPLIEQRSYP